MTNTDKAMLKTKKIPFGIICGSCGMTVFYSTIGLVLAYYVTAGIASQTSRTVSFLENWWQVLIFVVALITACVMIASFVLYLLKKSALIRAHDPIYFIAVEGEDETEESADKLSAEQNFAAELSVCRNRISALETELASVKTELERLRKSDTATCERIELDKIRDQLKQMLEQKRKVDEIAALESEIKENSAYVAEQRREKEKRRLAALERRHTSKSKESHAPTTKEKIDSLKREIDELRALLTANKGGVQ